ncbi:hypothetical protein O181_092992 [Austropuccinia psidii MF-1]|uniref:Uncharacterized protein n=1 Tax=Austropuccinia psidii MF-1 TaxID=1389203 RepID=A0A9Q3J0L5_9BASI|nr:hypothetical protein [Austropuccinia psidii MF-1]
MDPLDSQKPGQFGPWGALVTPTASRTRQRPKGPKKQKKEKGPLITIPSKMAIVMARTQDTQEGPKWPNTKDNGDKPPPWMLPKANQGEESPRGPIVWPIMEIYMFISPLLIIF